MKKRITALLLCLVMALSLVPTAVWAAETVDVKLGTTSLTTGKTTKTLGIETPATCVPLYTIKGSEIYADINKSENEYGLWQRLPRKTQPGYVFVPVDYRIPAQGSVTVSQPGIIGDCEFSLEGWKGTTYPGTGCLTFNYKALKAGTVTVTLTYYYNYGVYEVESGQWVDNNWYKETASFTVAVDDGSVDPSTKPALPNEDEGDFDDLWCRGRGAIYLECSKDWYNHTAGWDYLGTPQNGYSLSEVKVNDSSERGFSKSTWPWMCEMTIHVNAWISLYNDLLAGECGTHYLKSGSNEDFVIKWFWNKNTKEWTFAPNTHIEGPKRDCFIDLFITCDPSAAAPTKPGDDTVKNILTGNIVTVHCNTENKDYGPFALKDGTFTVSSVAGDAANGYTCTVTITDVDKYITEVGNGHTADTQTAENTVTLKSTDGKTWAKADANASFKLYAKCDGTQPPLDSEPKYEELKPLLDQKIKVEDKVKTGYQHHDTESFDLIADSYDMTKDNNGQVTLTIKAEKYVAAYNDKHAGHALVKGTVDSVQLTLEKSGDEWSIVDGKTPVTFEVECNELIPPTQPTNADLDSQTLQIKCNTDQNHPIETVPYSQGDYTINWKQGDTRCTVTFTLDKYVKYYSDLHGAHTAVANQTVTKGFHFVNGAWKADDTPRPEILVECQPSVAPTTKPDWTSYMVQVMCLTDGDSAEQYVANKPGSKKWFTESGIVKDANGDYTYTITINKQAYIDNFVKNRTAHGEVDGSTSNVITWKWVNNAWVCQTPDVAGASAGTKVRINVKCVLAPDWSGKYLVQVKCLNEQNTSVEYYITKSSATKPWVTESGIVSDGKGGYTYTITVNKQAYIDKFVKTYGPHAEADGSSNVITLKWENGDWVCTTPTVQSGTDPNTKALINVKCLYTVTFDADGGTPTPDAQTVMHGGFATAPTAPTKTGYEFKGWFEDGAAEAFNFGTKVILKNTKLTAKWEPTQYTITYVLNDKDAKHTNPTTYTVEDEFTITDATNGSFGRKFLEWRDADSKTGNKVSKIVKGTTDNITLYAIWQNPVNYFQVDKDGNKTLIRTDYVTVHEDYQTIAAIDKAGYTFDGWYKSTKDFGADSKKVADFTATNDKAEWKLFGRYIPNTNTPYVVEHYQEQLDGTYKLVETQNLAGTTDTTATAKAKKYDHFTYDSSVDGTLVSGNIAGDGSLVLKLYYTRNIYTVTFESNGGSAINSRKVKYEQTLADVDPIGSSFVPTKSGNTFAGWYTDKKLKNAFTFDTGITGSMTLYAKWDPAKAVNTTTPGGNNIGPAKNPYIKDTTKTDGKTVKSGNTFDAGIALYAGLGFLALTGSAVAIFKQRREYGA